MNVRLQPYLGVCVRYIEKNIVLNVILTPISQKIFYVFIEESAFYISHHRITLTFDSYTVNF